MEKEIDRIYWTTSAVAKLLHVAPSAIRFWLTTFKFDAKKRSWNNRKFNTQEVEKLTVIKKLLYNQPQHTIEGARLILNYGPEWAKNKIDDIWKKI
jgi:DNA-binding transcriptional MerR regulator